MASTSRFALPLILVASIGLNLWQTLQLRAARDAVLPARDEPSVGQTMPDLVAVPAGSTTATRVPITNDVPTIVYAFTHACGWCSSNIANIRHLAKATRGRYRVIGVSLLPGDPQTYAVNNQLGFPVYYSPDSATVDAYRFSRIPHTLVVDTSGRVQGSWYGAYADILEEEVLDFFKLESLPGLVPPPPYANIGARGE